MITHNMSMIAILVIITLTNYLYAAPVRVTKEEEKQWMRWVIPLPKQVRIESKLELPASDVKLRLRENAGDVEQTAAAELRQLFKDKAGVKDLTGSFEILIGVCDDEGKVDGVPVQGATGLKKLPNSEQAYVISPISEKCLALTATDERGVYYAVKTLQQLLRPTFTDGKVAVPLAHITDWPDLTERGEWGGSANDDVEWLAERKMNLIESHVSLKIDENGRGVATINEKLLERGRLHAVKVVPIITHLDQLARSGIYEKYPDLKGVGKSAQHPTYPDVVAPCFSKPKVSEILADWISSLAAQKGVTDINVWLSEHHLQCGCEDCKKVGQYALEAKAAVHGWEIARRKHPHVRLRILLTQGSYSTNDKVLAVVPPEVGVTYYDGGRTYNSSRDPMIYPLLADYAAKGLWLGCYPQLTASWRIVCPWSGPQFIKFRMTEFVQKGLKCLCGYATPNNRFYDFNVTAAAEWSWNSQGRSEREFAVAWATWHSLSDPEKAADWAVMLGPVGWDVYGSGIPYPYFFANRAAKIIEKRKEPKLGEGMFRYFPTPEHIEKDLTICDKALKLAEELRSSELIAGTKTIRGYVEMVKAIWMLGTALAGKEKPEVAKAQEAMTLLSEAEAANVEGLRTWGQTVGPGLGGARFVDTVNVTEQTVAAIGDALAPLGILDPGKPYRLHKIGQWETEDFNKHEMIQKQWEVTDFISGEGTYTVRFKYTKGWWGLHIKAVMLMTAPKEDRDHKTQVAIDKHDGSAAYRNKANVYELTLKDYNPNVKYFIVADIKGVTSIGKPQNRQGCCGDLLMRKRRENEEMRK